MALAMIKLLWFWMNFVDFQLLRLKCLMIKGVNLLTLFKFKKSIYEFRTI